MARKSAKWTSVVLFSLFCLSLSISILISDPLFTYGGLKPVAVPATTQYLAFVFGQDTLPAAFIGDQASHMRDVAWLLRTAVLIAVASGFAALYFVRPQELSRVASHSALILLALAIVASLLPFDLVFHMFHEIFFPQGNWTFPADSVLITFYPETFFAWYAAAWAAYSVFTACVLGLFGRFFSR